MKNSSEDQGMDELYLNIRTIAEKIRLKRTRFTGYKQNDQKSLRDNEEDETKDGNNMGC